MDAIVTQTSAHMWANRGVASTKHQKGGDETAQTTTKRTPKSIIKTIHKHLLSLLLFPDLFGLQCHKVACLVICSGKDILQTVAFVV